MSAHPSAHTSTRAQGQTGIVQQHHTTLRGLDSYGLDSYGLYSYGLYSYGPQVQTDIVQQHHKTLCDFSDFTGELSKQVISHNQHVCGHM